MQSKHKQYHILKAKNKYLLKPDVIKLMHLRLLRQQFNFVHRAE